MNNKENLVKTGTTTVGIVCKDGIVLAADRRATAGYMISSKKFEKVAMITNNIAVTMAGLVSDAQLIIKIIKAQLKLNSIRRNKEPTVKEAANLLGSLVYHNIRRFSAVPGIVGFLIGGKDNTGFYLYNLGVDGSITTADDYESDGSGSPFALGVLESSYVKNMSINDGVKLAVKAINTALQRDIASGNGIDVVTITKEGVKKVLERELEVKLQI